MDMPEIRAMWITNNRTCPLCGSDMERDAEDSPHDVYTEHCICKNPECGISHTFHN